jgi:hypothetical protein
MGVWGLRALLKVTDEVHIQSPSLGRNLVQEMLGMLRCAWQAGMLSSYLLKRLGAR